MQNMSQYARDAYARVIARAWADEDYLQRLLDPATTKDALAEEGIQVPEGIGVQVLLDTSERLHLVIPMLPEQLEDVEDVDKRAFFDERYSWGGGKFII